MARKIEVTEHDIERARQNDSYKCVVAQAIARNVKTATRIEVDTQTIRFTDSETRERFQYLTPFAVQGYIVAFDAGDEIEPFGVQLRSPIKVTRRTLTDEGKQRQRKAAAMRKYRETKADEPKPKPEKELSPEEQAEAQKAAYKEAVAETKGATTQVESKGSRPTPRVFKKKSRSYGSRLLRVNQQDAKAS